MYYAYVLQSQTSGYTYVGYSADLRRRISEHRRHKVGSTAKLVNIELVHYEAYRSQTDALRRERYLKTTQGKKGLKLMCRESLFKIKR